MRWFLAAAACSLLAAGYTGTTRADEAVRIRHVLLISIDGLHALDLARYVRIHPKSALATLARTGIAYSQASSTVPSDSYPALLGLVTGGTPAVTGVYYDTTYDRALAPAGSGPDCTARGAEVLFDKNIDRDFDAFDGGGIDETKLPRDPNRGCRPVYPHDYLRVNTIFEIVKAAGGRTAWSDKHPAYEIVNGPSGTGLDDGFFPEIAAHGTADTLPTVETYDDAKVRAIVFQMHGFDHTGAQHAPVPTVFGMNFQAVNTGQVTPGSGYLDASGTPGGVLSAALGHVDASLATMLAALDANGLRASTAVIVTAKHGQSPIDPAKREYIAPPTLRAIVDGVGPHLVARLDQGDGALLWLADRSRTADVVAALRANAATAGIAEVFSGAELLRVFPGSPDDSRRPDILVRVRPGILYTPRSHIAAHGGMNAEDRNVALMVSLPGQCPAQISMPVTITQVAPTILALLRIDPQQLAAARTEGTSVLPAIAARWCLSSKKH